MDEKLKRIKHKKMCDEIHCQFKDGAEMGKMVTEKRFSFAFINLERAEFYDNFNTCLYSRDTDPLLNG